MTTSRKRRLLRLAVRAILALVVLVVGAYLLRGPLFGSLLRERLEEELSAALGSRVTIGAIEGGWISDLTLVDVAVPSPAPDSGLRRARVDRVAVTYRLLDLLDDPVTGLDHVQVRGFDLVVEVIGDGAPASDEDALGDLLRHLPLDLPGVRLDGRIEVRAPDLHIAAQLQAERARRGDVELVILELDVDAGGRTLHEELVAIGIRQEREALRLVRAFEVAGIEVRELQAELIDGRSRLTAALDVGGDVHVVLERDVLRAGLRGVDASAVRGIVDALDPGALPEVPAVRVDADVELTPGPRPSVVARDVRATLGENELTIAEARLADVTDVESFSWTDLLLHVRDAVALGDHLGLDLGAGPVARVGIRDLQVGSSAGGRSDAPVQVRLLTRIGDLAGGGTIAFPEDLSDWRGIALRVAAWAALDTAAAVAAAPETWALPELVGEVRCDALVDGTLGAPGGSGRIEASQLAVEEHLVDELDVEATFEDGVVRVTELRATADFGRLEARGAIDVAHGTLSDAAFALEVPDLETIATLFEALPPLEGALEASGVLTGSIRPDPQLPEDGFPDDVRIDARAAAEGLVVDGARLGRVTAAVSLAGPVLDVERVQLDGDLGRLDASGRVHLVERSVAVPGFAVRAPDIGALSRWLPALESIDGAIEADGTFRRDAGEPWRDARVGLTARAPRLHVPGADLREVTLRIDADDGRVRLHEALASTPFGVVAAEGELGHADASVSATLRRLDVGLERRLLGLEGDPLPLRLRAPVEVRWEPDRLEVRGLDADFLDGRVRADLVRGRDASLFASGEGLDLSLLAPHATGRLDGALQLEGDPESPRGTLTAVVPELSWQGESGRLEIDARQDALGLHVARCEVAAGRLLQLSAEGYAPWIVGESGARRLESRRASMSIEARSETPDHWLGRFAPEGVHATFAAVSCEAAGPTFEAAVAVRDLEWRDEELSTVRLDGDTTVRIAAGESRSTAVVAGGGDGPLRVTGSLEVAGFIDWRDPLGSLDMLPDAPLAGSLRLAVPDIGEVATWIEDLRSIDGAAHVDVTLSGTVGRPDWRGTLAADGISVTARDDLPPIDRGRLRARLAGRTATVDELSVRLGYSPVAITGTVALDDAGEAVLDLHAVGDNVQIVRSQYTRVRADVDVQLAGPVSGLLLSGRARVTDAWYTKPTETGSSGADAGAFQLFAATSEPWASMRFDVAVTARDTVRLQNDVVAGSLSLDLELKGTGAVPEPEGVLSCRDVAVRLPVTRMTVESAVVTFPPDRPFDPDLRVAAFARVKGYDMDIQVSGGASDMRVLIATSPPLSQEDALILLATGAPPAGEGAGGQVGASAAAGAGSMLGEAAMEWLSGPRTAGEERLTDRVEVYIGREVSESGIATVEAEVEILPGWYLRFERDRWEDYAAGVLWRVRFE